MKMSKLLSPKIAILYILVAFAFCFFLFPPTMDDYWLLHDYDKGYRTDAGESVLEGLKSFWISRVYFDTARLSNFVCLPFLLLPRWTAALISFVAFALSYCLMCRLSGFGKKDIGGLTLMLLFLTLGLPWHDSLFTGAYSANYWWETPLLLGLVILFLREKPTSRVGIFFASMVLGCWHEIFGVTFLSGAFAVLVLGKVKWRSDRIAACIGVFVGLMALAVSPAMQVRLPNETGHTISILSFLQLCYHICGFWPFLALWLVCLSRKKWRNVALSPLPVFVLVSCIVVIIVQCLVIKARAGFPAYLMSFVGIGYVLSRIAPSFVRTNTKVYKALCWSALAIMAVHISVAVWAVYDMSRERKAIEDVYLAHTVRPVTIFADIKFDWQQPILALKKNFYERHSHGWHYICFRTYHCVPLHHVVPVELKSYVRGAGKKIPGDANAEYYKDYVIMPYRSELRFDIGASKQYSIYVKYGDGIRNTDLSLFNGADGKQYIFVNPYSHTWEYNRVPDCVFVHPEWKAD